MSKISPAMAWIAAAAFGLALAGSGAALAQGLGVATIAAASTERPAGVRIEMTDEMGPVMADPGGHTLYTWRGDKKPGVSECNDVHYTHTVGAGSVSYELPVGDRLPACQTVWPPFRPAADARPVGAWSIIERADKTRQWAYGGRPLYTFVADQQPGEINGEGVPGGIARLQSSRSPLWAPLDAPSGVIAQVTASGRVLMTDKGKALYIARGGVAKAAFCTGACTKGWTPLAAPAIAGEPPRGWAIADLPTGGRQWVFQGRPVYTFDGDAAFGDLNGAEEAGWQPATLQKPLAPPPGFSVQMTATGPVYADQNGMTVYSYSCSDETADREVCDIPGFVSELSRHSICGPADVCIKTWRPVLAARDAKPVGRTWSIVTVDPTGAHMYAAPGQTGGLRVWAYLGRPIYTYIADKEPGDIVGHLVSAGALGGYAIVRADGDVRGGF